MFNVFFVSVFIILIRFVYCDKYNVLMLIADDLRPTLGCYDDPLAITPNIDSLASNGFLFKNAYAQQALCGPSRTSLLTSRRPDSLHLYDIHSYWRKSVGNFTTLPQYFKEHGYETISFGKIFHPGITSNNTDDYPLSWSFPTYHPSTEKYKFSSVCPSILKHFGKLEVNIICPVDVSKQPEHTLPDIQTIQKSMNFNPKSHFFIAIGLHKPHIPFKYPKEFLRYFPLSSITPKNKINSMPSVAWNPWTDLRIRDDVRELNLSFPYGPMPEYFEKLIIQSYYASTSYIDDLIGKLLKDFEKKNLLNDTIIVLFSDHGWSLGEHGEFSKYSNFDVALKVPLIFHIPQKLTNSMNISKITNVINEPVELVDIFPTLVELAGLKKLVKCNKISHKMLCTEGRSLKKLMTSSKQININKNDRFAFSQYPRPSLSPQENSDQPRLKDIIIMGYTMKNLILRYTEWVAFNNTSFKPNWSKLYARELYLDESESENVAEKLEMQSLVNELSKKLRKHVSN